MLQVSVPQSELLSLISAAKSLGVRGLAESGVDHDHDSVGEDLRHKRGDTGLKRENGENGVNDVKMSPLKKIRHSHSVPKLQHKHWSLSQPRSVNICRQITKVHKNISEYCHQH